MNLTETEKAYLAGLFDGEGTIGYYCKLKVGYHTASLAIYNTDARVMTWIKERIDFGGIYLNKGGKHKAWQWQLNSKAQIQEFLTAIRPYLVIKADQVDLLFSLWNAEEKTRAGRKLSGEVLQMRADTELKLKSLKVAQLHGIH